jgi:Fic family protein
MKKPFFPPQSVDQDTLLGLFNIQRELNQNSELSHFIKESIENYYPWDKFSNLKLPITDFTHQQLWAYLKTFCRPRSKDTPLVTDKKGHPFWYSQTDRISKSIHLIDKLFSGNPLLQGYSIDSELTDEWARKRIITSLIDEAINSSQIEGAAITRRKAKELIRSGEKPKNKDEVMVLNNYKVIRLIKSTLIKDDISIEMIQEIHQGLTQDLLDPRDVGQFRRDLDENDKVNVYDSDGAVLHEPPPAETLKTRLQDLCRFINSPEPFIHPVIKAIIIHFSIGYIHPFYDGNGRVARGLFYWFLLKHGYTLFEFISISEHINNTPGQYKRAYLYAENDDNDLTYFIYYHLTIIEQCLDSLKRYIHQKLEEVKVLKNALRDIPDINVRQLDLLNHALKHRDDTDQYYTIESHQNSNNIAYATAREDLFRLANRGLLEKRKLGKKMFFYIPPNLHSKILV